MREDIGIQHPVYYISKALLNVETRYPKIEKWALMLVITATSKLRLYFQAYPVVVMMDQ